MSGSAVKPCGRTWRPLLCAAIVSATAAMARPATAAEVLAFRNCVFEADRYIVCRTAPAEVEAAIRSGKSVHPNVALTSWLRRHFERLGCVYSIEGEAFWINGVFFTFDSRAMAAISCDGIALSLKFADSGMSVKGITFLMDRSE